MISESESEDDVSLVSGLAYSDYCFVWCSFLEATLFVLLLLFCLLVVSCTY